MSIKSKRQKLHDQYRYRLAQQYWRRYAVWANREPSMWRIVAWIKWKSERPYMPKWVEEYDELWDNHSRYSPQFK